MITKNQNNIFVIVVLSIFFSCGNKENLIKNDLFKRGDVFVEIRDDIETKYGQNDNGAWTMMDIMSRRPAKYMILNQINSFESFYYTNRDYVDSNRYLLINFADTLYMSYTLNFEVPKRSKIYSDITNIEITQNQYDSICQSITSDSSKFVLDIRVNQRGRRIKIKER